ncbi:Pentatricopeptide repeat-containing protein [Acorus calamus]|uniref:Pentatricopeptide repeat-containing protein n=1 Tax=Acorus calamus TaxID=4465 RepID=A0AAV9CWD1_ACOCL|nr:Pentatricopeptide repeat-containing protein [Acorus calamus]
MASTTLTRLTHSLKTLKHHHHHLLLRPISAAPSLLQEPQFDLPPSTTATPTTCDAAAAVVSSLPPNPASGSPLYNDNWRTSSTTSGSLISLITPTPTWSEVHALSRTLDAAGIMDVFADWTTLQRWTDVKDLFELWTRSLDRKDGKPNRPDVQLYNYYLRANLMLKASAGELLDLVARMEEYGLSPNTASFNLVLKAMYEAREMVAVQQLMDRSLVNLSFIDFRMLETGKESLPDEESYDLVIGLLILENQIDSALKYLDLTLKSGCVTAGRLDTLTSIIERCKKMDQNKALCPSWNLCNYIADVALQTDHSQLAFYSLEFFARWIARGENARPPVLLSVDEGLIVSALGTASRTYNASLSDASWEVLKRSLRQKRVPNPESYIGKIFAHSSMGQLQRAFSTLNEFEAAYGDSAEAEELFSPFTSLHPLVYFQLENLSNREPPYKSVAALNCIILGCANIWDLDRAYQTFEAISGTFELVPNIHSYNALINAFGKLKKTTEATRVYEHLISLGVIPNEKTYSLLVDAHLINRDPKAALSVIDEMEKAEFIPSKETLKKVRRRCHRELNDELMEQVKALVQKHNYRITGDNRRDLLFRLHLINSRFNQEEYHVEVFSLFSNNKHHECISGLEGLPVADLTVELGKLLPPVCPGPTENSFE